MKSKSFLRRWSTFLVIILIVFIAKADFVLNVGLVSLTDHHTPVIVSLQQMESDMFEGIAEAYSYVLSTDKGEKDEFEEKSAHFDMAAEAFQEVAQAEEEEQESELEAYNNVVEAKHDLVARIEKMFADFERRGVASGVLVQNVEAGVNNFTDKMNSLVEIEKQELDEHVEVLETKVMWEATLLLIISMLLFGVMVIEYKKKK
jgi:predicted RND superfamily exporter protein